MSEAWLRILGKPPAAALGSRGTVAEDGGGVEVRILEAEIKRLRTEREAHEAAERDLIQELQRRCDRIIALEMKVDEQRTQIEKQSKEREEQASYETEIMSLLRDAQTPPPDVAAKVLAAAGSSSTSSSTTATTTASSISVGSLKSRILELEIERSALADQRAKQQDEITSLRVQVNQLKQVIHELGSTEEREAAYPPAASIGLDPATLTLLDKCPWNEGVLKEIQVVEEAYEWQTWSIFHDWNGAPQHVSQALQGILSGELKEAKGTEEGSGGPPRILTDRSGSKGVRLEDASLPGPGWEWIGGWRVDCTSGSSDADGWCYGSMAEDILAGKGGDHSLVANGKRRVRRRRWVRLRLLVRVEGLCDNANQYLALLAKVASMDLLTRKLSEQVLRAQGVINDREVQASRTVILDKQIRSLQASLSQSEKRASELQRKLSIVQNEERILRACQVAPLSLKDTDTGSFASTSTSSSTVSLPVAIADGKDAVNGLLLKWFPSREAATGTSAISNNKEKSGDSEGSASPEEDGPGSSRESPSPPAGLSGDATSSAFTKWFQRERASPPFEGISDLAVSRSNEEEEGHDQGRKRSVFKWFNNKKGAEGEDGGGEVTVQDFSGYFGTIEEVAELLRDFGDLDEEQQDGGGKSPVDGRGENADCRQAEVDGEEAEEEEEEEEILRGLTPEGAKLVQDLHRLSPPKVSAPPED